jgi:hypothetical protein
MSLTPIEKQSFENVTVVLDGKYFNECKFSGCTLIYTGGDYGWVDTTFDLCNLRLQGLAERTTRFLYEMGRLPADLTKDFGFEND